jgi:hypothetical protein
MRTTATKLLLTVALGLAGAAAAADLPRFLPAETLFAVGVEGLSEHEAKARPFIEEWERLNLTELLETAFAEELGEEQTEVPELGAGLLDLLGREAWLAVSASQFNPLPAVTVLALVTPEGMAAVQDLLAEVETAGESEQMTEGDVTFTVVTPADEEEIPTPIAYALFDDVVLVSTNPDVARGVLRRYQGASEPNLAESSGYLGTIGALRSGNAYTYLDLAAAVDVAAPFAAGMGVDALVERLGAAADTAGVYGSVTTITDDGFQSLSVRVLGSEQGDPQLYDLLSGGGPVSDDALAFVPPTALGVSVGTANLPGWWSWIGDVVTSDPSLGITDLDQMVMDAVGLDPQRALFGWMGEEFAAITMGYGAATAMPTDLTNPLGESVYLVEATDEAAASAGLNEFFTLATGFASTMMDPMGEGGMVAPAQRDVGGVAVTDWQLAEGFTISVAVTDGYALIATTPQAMDAALGARNGGATLSATLSPLRGRVPDGVTSFTLSDDRAALGFATQTLVDQFGMLSGMAGGDIDFEAVEAASSALSEFLAFVTERFSGSVSYSTVDRATVRSEGYSFVDW